MEFETILQSDLSKPVQVKQLTGNFFSGDNKANKITVELFKDGSPYELTGGISAYVIREDKKTVVIADTQGTHYTEKDGNKYSVILPQSAYVVEGQVSIVVKVGTVTVGACTTYIYKSTTSVIVDPGSVIPDISELEAIIASCVAATEDAQTATLAAQSATASANTATNAANSVATYIGGLTVVASTLSPDDPATATLSTESGHAKITFGIPKGESGNETIDDDAGLGDIDVVWSADKSSKEIISIEGRKANTDSAFLYKEATGEVIEVEEAVSDCVKQMSIAIAPLQDLHGYDHPWVGGAGKNKLALPYYESTKTKNSVEITVYDDGSVKLNGTASANTEFYLKDRVTSGNSAFILPVGNYVLSGCPTGYSTYNLRIGYNRGSSGTTIGNDTGSGVAITDSDGTLQYGIWIAWSSGAVFNNLMIHPMIRLSTETDASWEPYKNICPISGWTGAEVVGTGKNLITNSKNTSNGYYNNHYITYTNSYSDNSNYYVSEYFRVEPNTNYRYSTNATATAPSVCFYDASKNFISGVTIDTAKTTVITTPSNAVYARASQGKDDTRLFQLEKGSVATTYEPFGKQYSISFPSDAGTVYGGTLTVNQDGTGSLVVDKAFAKGTADNITMRSDGFRFYYNPTPIGDNTKQYNIISDKIPTATTAQLGNISTTHEFFCYLHSSSGGINFNTIKTYASTSAMIADIGEIEFVYALATASTYTLTTDQVLHLLSGHNTIYSDCGITTILYPTDKYLTAEQAERERIHESITVSSPVQTITDGADNVPMDVSMAIEPVQDLHGYANPWVGGAGKNLCPIDHVDFTAVSTWVNLSNTAASSVTSGTKVHLTAGTYYVSLTEVTNMNTFQMFDAEGNYLRNGGSGSFTLASEQDTYIRFKPSNTSTATKFNIQLETGSSATTWTPYSNICPISGWDKAEVTRTGKNLLDDSNIKRGYYSADKIWNAHNNYITYEMNLPAGAYTFSSDLDTCYILRYFIGDTATTTSATQSSVSFTLTTADTFAVCIRKTTSSDISSLTPKSMIEKGSSATTYEAYSSTVYTIPFNTDVYGGSLAVNKDGTGTLVVDRASSKVSDFTWTYSTNSSVFYVENSGASTIPFTTPPKSTGYSGISSAYQNFVEGWSTFKVRNSGFQISNSGFGSKGSLLVKDTRYDNVSDFTNAMANETFVYPLSTPLTYTIPAPVIRSLLGTNNVWADTGNVLALNYAADTKLYIDNLTKPTEDDMIANENIPADTYFTINNTLYKSTQAIAQGETIDPATGGNCVDTSVAEVFNSLLSAEGVSF